MIEEQGTVVSLSGALVEVRTERRGACAGCGSQSGCGTSLMDRLLGRRAVTLRARNQAGAAVGDRVVVGVSEEGLLTAAFAAYLVPILGLATGGTLGQLLAQWGAQPGTLSVATDGGSDLSALIGAFLGFVLALFWLRRYSAKRVRHPEFEPVVLRRLGGEASCQPASLSGR